MNENYDWELSGGRELWRPDIQVQAVFTDLVMGEEFGGPWKEVAVGALHARISEVDRIANTFP